MRQITKWIQQARQELKPLDLTTEEPHSEAMRAFLNYYGIEQQGVTHHFGYFKAAGFQLAAHIYLPEKPVGMVLLMHGYLDHCGTLRNLIQELIAANYGIATYDMPGHGLTNGDRVTIDDFSTYRQVFENFLGFVQENFKQPIHVISFSTGGAVVMDYMLNCRHEGLGKVIFLAPLVRPFLFHLSILGYQLASPFVKTVPRKFQHNSSNRGFCHFVNYKDPLQTHLLPLGWFAALIRWNRRVKSYQPSEYPITIIQGEQDRVVEWKYNLTFFRKKFSQLQVILIPEGRHQLLNESKPIRGQVLAKILTILQNK